MGQPEDWPRFTLAHAPGRANRTPRGLPAKCRYGRAATQQYRSPRSVAGGNHLHLAGDDSGGLGTGRLQERAQAL